VTVSEDEIVVEARAEGVLELLTNGGQGADETARPILLTHVVAWRPNPDTSANFSGRFRVEARRRTKPKAVPTEPPPIVKLLAKAVAWQADLDAGRVKNRAALASRGDLSTVRVTQVLRLLDLDPVIREWLASLPPGTPARYVAERQLRGIATMSRAKQVAAVRKRWGTGILAAPSGASPAGSGS
jgi:hypothetical protein